MLAACGGNSSGETGSDDPFEVLALTPLSGPLAPYGALQVAGLETAAALINEEGGIDGREVVVKSEDNGGDAATGVDKFQTYVSKNGKPDFLMPGLTSQEIMAVLPLATRNEVLSVHIGAATDANDPENFPYTFGAGATFDDINKAVVEHLDEKGIKKIALIGPDNASSRLSVEALTKFGTEVGITLVSELVAPDSVDVTPTLLKLDAEDPDVLFLVGSGPINGVYFTSAETAGWDRPIMGSFETCGTNFDGLVDPAVWSKIEVNCYGFGVEGIPASQTDAFVNFRDRLSEFADSPLKINIQSPAFTYNMLLIGWGAYEASESNDIEDLAAMLEAGEVNAEIRKHFIGPQDWDFSKDDHTITWTADDLPFVGAGATVDGLLQPASR